jgi:hypothetical protein
MYLKTTLLREWVYNTLLFTPGKIAARKSQLGDDVLITYGGGLSLTATDNYVAIRCGFGGTDSCVISGERLAAIEKHLRDVDVEEVEITVAEGSIYFGKEAAEYRVFDQLSSDPFKSGHVWRYIREYINSDAKVNTPSPQYCVSSSRLSKLSLLKPRDKYPLAVKFREDDLGREVWVWKYGPYSRGVLAPLDLDEVIANHDTPEEAIWVW